ncbi:MAG: hypothetical protein AAB225_30345 [Acidobacteriota bacterium]
MRCLVFLAAVAIAAPAQTVVEHAVIGAAGAKAAAAAAGVGKAAGSILEGVRRQLQSAAKPGAQVAVPAGMAAEPAPKPAPAIEYADPAGITVGLERAELLRKFGEPSMKTAASDGAETWFYTPPNRDGIVATLCDGKVTAVSPAPKPKQETAAVVILQ